MVGLKTYSKEDWEPIASEHSGKTPRSTFDKYDSESEYDDHTVTRGIQDVPGSGGATQVSQSGFLEDPNGKVIAGAKDIPRDVEDRKAKS